MRTEEEYSHNSTHPKDRVSYSADKFAVYQSSVFPMMFSAENPRLCKVSVKTKKRHTVN